jgi:EmrB/QacA subfamily drug resistance transporter
MSNIGEAPCDLVLARTGVTRAPEAGGTAGWVLAATVLGSSMAFADGSVVNVALPVIQERLRATITDAQWVVEAYLVFLSALILVGGAVGDRWGRERVYAAGVALFGLASAGCGLAPSMGVLIAARAVQGIGAALLIPESLAMLGAAFTPGERGRAIGSWAAATAIVSAIAPPIGGWLASHASWRWIFLINIPIAVVILLMLWQRVPMRRPHSAGPLDLTGALLITLGLAGVTYGLVEAPSLGFSSIRTLGAFVAGLVFIVAFAVVEDRVARPLVPRVLFRSRAFTGANLLTLFLYAAVGGVMFFLPFELIQVHGYSPAEAGAAMLPAVILMATLSRSAGALADQVGQRFPLTLGPALTACGIALLGSSADTANYWHGVFPGMVVLGLGMTLSVTPLTTAVLTAVDDEFEGAASGVNNAVARVATLLAIAILGLVVVRVFTSRLSNTLADTGVPPAVRQAVQAQALRLAGIVPPAGVDAATRAAVAHAVASAYTTAFRSAMFISAGFAAVAALIGFIALPSTRRRAVGAFTPRRVAPRHR